MPRYIDADALMKRWSGEHAGAYFLPDEIIKSIDEQPEAQLEPLTDKEQRIFLAAMGREEKVCKEVDAKYLREPYEESLARVCKEIERKVKKALWT